MQGLEELLKEEQKRLMKIKKCVEDRLSSAPEGTLRITNCGKRTQYMLCTGKNEKCKRQGEYIRRENSNIVKPLAQKAYDKRIKRIVDRRLKQLENICNEYKDDELLEIYNSQSDIRKNMVEPVETPFEQRIQKWKEVPYQGKGFAEGAPVILSKKGERVRSKSEKILADTFYDMGIEYKYECPLLLKGYGTIYPDFTLLSKRTRKEVYWEHDGRMDDPDYADKAIRKIDSYIANGIIPGDRLIVTYETSNFVLRDRTVKELIHAAIL